MIEVLMFAGITIVLSTVIYILIKKNYINDDILNSIVIAFEIEDYLIKELGLKLDRKLLKIIDIIKESVKNTIEIYNYRTEEDQINCAISKSESYLEYHNIELTENRERIIRIFVENYIKILNRQLQK